MAQKWPENCPESIESPPRAALAYCGADKIVEVRAAGAVSGALDPAAQLLSARLPIQEYLVPAQTPRPM